MLVLSRREQETIVLPAIKTTIQLLKVRGQVARIGIDAPDFAARLDDGSELRLSPLRGEKKRRPLLLS